ncbi:hypothetical protein glysoja_026244 [Glycine soja]|uniref:Uncharacterized protein n=1 Tax=Glycine soja TaxID=3848 RepID=A0A0B2R798_GLYSO|nr:hypothetical protein glysoja_026244 [Glycine soja]
MQEPHNYAWNCEPSRKTTNLAEPLTLNLVESTSAPHSVPANIPENHVVANYISAQGATMAVDRIAAVAHKVAVAKSSVRSARNVATKPQRVTAGWFVQLQHNFAPPNFGALQFFAICSNHTLLMAPLPLPGCHTYLVHIFRTQRLLLVINPLTIPPNNGTTFQQ